METPAAWPFKIILTNQEVFADYIRTTGRSQVVICMATVQPGLTMVSLNMPPPQESFEDYFATLFSPSPSPSPSPRPQPYDLLSTPNTQCLGLKEGHKQMIKSISCDTSYIVCMRLHSSDTKTRDCYPNIQTTNFHNNVIHIRWDHTWHKLETVPYSTQQGRIEGGPLGAKAPHPL